MEYRAYMHSIEPKSELKDAVRERVKAAIEAQNRIQIRKRHFMLSAAACFAVLAVFAVSFYALNRNTIYNNSIAETNDTDSDTAEKYNNGSAASTAQSASTQGGQIIINAESNDGKYGAQKILIDGKVYYQYCKEDVKQGWGEDNGNIVIDKADIGDKICILDADNLVDDWTSLSTLSSSAAKSNIFNKAEVYQYNPCKNGTVLVVVTSDNYYLFTLSGFFDKMSAAAIIDLYTVSGNNPVRQAEIYKQNEKTSTLTDTEKTDNIVSILTKAHTNYSVWDIVAESYAKEDEEYTILFTFEDDTVLEMTVFGHYFIFDCFSKDDYGYYELNDADFKALSAVIAE